MTVTLDTYKKPVTGVKEYYTSVQDEDVLVIYNANPLVTYDDSFTIWTFHSLQDQFILDMSDNILTAASMEAANMSFAEDWESEDDDYWASYLE